MSAGIQTWDAAGNIQLDMTKRLPRVLDTREVTINQGVWTNVTIPDKGSFNDIAVFPLQMWLSNGSAIIQFFCVIEKTAAGYRVMSYRGNGHRVRIQVLGY